MENIGLLKNQKEGNMRYKIIKILSNWLTFMDKEKLNKLKIDKNRIYNAK